MPSPRSDRGQGHRTREHIIKQIRDKLFCTMVVLGGLWGPASEGRPLPPNPLLQQDIDGRSVRHLEMMAQQYDREGANQEAAMVYEELIEREPARRPVLGQRLIDLYLELRQPEKAVEWAKSIKDQNPDPDAFMAQVYDRAGAHEQAAESLKYQAETTSDMDLRARRLHQLADLHEKHGRDDEAGEVLHQAVVAALDGAYEDLAIKRLCRFHAQHGTLEQQIADWEQVTASDDDAYSQAERDVATRSLAAARTLIQGTHDPQD